MKKSLLGAVCAAVLVVLSNTSHAALVNSILGLDIDGTLYDVTIHTNAGDSFQGLWDADNDGAWGGGTSVFTEAPLFWGDAAGASLASIAIIGALGSADWVDSFGTQNYDRALVPWGAFDCALGGQPIPLTSGTECIGSRGDARVELTIDNDVMLSIISEDMAREDFRYASFTVSAVPVPAAVWLFGSGLLGLVGIARRKKA